MAYNQNLYSQSPLSGITLSLTAVTLSTSTFTLSAASNAVGNTTTYTGVFGNASIAGRAAVISGFVNSGNNLPNGAIILSNTPTTVTIENSGGVAESAVGSLVLSGGETVGVYTVNGTVPAILQLPFQNARIVITGFTTFSGSNNGSFIIVGANAGFITVANNSRPASGQNGTGTIVQPFYPPAGVISVRGEGQGAYSLQGIPAPVLFNLSANPDSYHFVLTEEGNDIDTAGMDVFQDSNGNHGFQMWSVYDGTGANPSFFEMAWEGGPFISLELPDEFTGFTISSNHIIPQSGSSTSVEISALSDTTTTGFNSSLILNGNTGATGNASITLDNTIGITIDDTSGNGIDISSSHGIAINTTAGSGNGITIQNAGTTSTGTNIIDEGSSGISISATGTGLAGYGISLASTLSSPSLGIFIRDNGTTGILLEEDNTTTGGITLNNNSGGSGGVAIIDTSVSGGGGISLSNTAGGGIFLTSRGVGGTISLINVGSAGTDISDTGGGGLTLNSAGASDATNVAFVAIGNTGPLSTFIEDDGGGGITLDATSDFAVAYAITSVANHVGGNTTYTGTFPATSLGGNIAIIAGFTNSNNNGQFGIQSNTTTTMIVANPNGVAETHAATATQTSYIELINTGAAGTSILDSGGGGIEIDVTGGSPPADLSLNPSGHAVMANGHLVSQTIASGTAALGTATINSANFTLITATATGALTTDNLLADFTADPTGTVGYEPSANGMLTIIKYITAGQVNFKVVNNTALSITPGAVTLQWRVIR